MFRPFALMILLLAATWVTANPNPIVVDCGAGQSLNRALAKMDKYTPATVQVKGTCSEYVQIKGFDGLTLKGSQGASLLQPTTDPGNGLNIYVLFIDASRSVTIEGFAIHSRSSALGAIGIGRGSRDVRLHNLTIDGAGVFSALVFDNSQASFARVTARDPGYAAVFVGDMSNAHIEDCLFEDSSPQPWNVGVHVEAGGVSMHGTTIRNMQVGLYIAGGMVQINEDSSYYPLGGTRDVTIENPAGTNFWGVWIGNGGLLGIGNATLRITKAGQSWGGNTGAVFVSDGGTLAVPATNGGTLVVSGSQGQGVIVSNNSHASLADSSITGSSHGGLVAVNQSTIAVGSNTSLSQISGNGTDLFCDSKSVITGGANIGNATNVQCSNLLPGDYESLP